MVESLGYAHFFLATALMGIPTLLLIVLQWRRDKRLPAPQEAPPAAEKA